MEFRILGPLEVVDGGQSLRLGGARQRALLALLLTQPNEVVSTDRLIDELWGAQPPKAALNTVQYYISQLRKLLGVGRIETCPPGYRIRVKPDELDLQRFERLVNDGGEEALQEALSLWRGAALADLAYESFAQGEAMRLDELRLVAFERRVDAGLERGKHDELVPELEQLIVAHPLRERPRGQLMLALYRSGRQAEALGVYQDARRMLVDELGIDPSPALQELERAMLRQDPSLQSEASTAPYAPQRSILVVSGDGGSLDVLLSLAEPLTRRPPRELIIAGLIAEGRDLARSTAALGDLRERLAERGVQARVAAYTSAAPGDDAALLAAKQDVDLVLRGAPASLLERGVFDADLEALLHAAPCDIGVLVKPDAWTADSTGPVVVPFGGIEHDWSAVEIAAWLARSLGLPLRLAGTEDAEGRRDASRLLASASLVVQAAVGVVSEPTLVAPGVEGMLQAVVGASLLVLGLSERWRVEGLGEARLSLARAVRAPTLLVRHGLRPGGLAPPGSMTRFTWTLAGG